MMKKTNNLQRKLQSMLALLLAVGMLLGGAAGFPAAQAGASSPSLVNVALHKPAYTDKVLSYKVPALAVDGDTSSASYCDMGNALPAALTVDLLAAYEIEQIRVTPYYEGGRGYSYDVYAAVAKGGSDRAQRSRRQRQPECPHHRICSLCKGGPGTEPDDFAGRDRDLCKRRSGPRDRQ